MQKGTGLIGSEWLDIKNEKFVDDIIILTEDKIKPALNLKRGDVQSKLIKLIICEPGNTFKKQALKTNEEDNTLIGYLIVQLPSIFTGGDMKVVHTDDVIHYKNSGDGSSIHCMFVAHYNSCALEMDQVTSGNSAFLIYSLHWDGFGNRLYYLI